MDKTEEVRRAVVKLLDSVLEAAEGGIADLVPQAAPGEVRGYVYAVVFERLTELIALEVARGGDPRSFN
jgi:hypothetical protein